MFSVGRETLKEQAPDVFFSSVPPQECLEFSQRTIAVTYMSSSLGMPRPPPFSLFWKAGSSPRAQWCWDYLSLACGSVYSTASFFWGSSSWQSSTGSGMNGFWEVSSYEGPFVPGAHVFLTFRQSVIIDNHTNLTISTGISEREIL